MYISYRTRARDIDGVDLPDTLLNNQFEVVVVEGRPGGAVAITIASPTRTRNENAPLDGNGAFSIVSNVTGPLSQDLRDIQTVLAVIPGMTGTVVVSTATLSITVVAS